MNAGDLLNIQPQELLFPFELWKQITCTLQLSNKTNKYVAFKVKTRNPNKYTVRPHTGIVLPRSTCNVTVKMLAQNEAPPDMQCNDKFLLQSVVASCGATTKDITTEMFNKESGHNVEECILRVVYVDALRPPYPVQEKSEEDFSPRVSISENGHPSAAEVKVASKAFNERVEHQDTSLEALTDEESNLNTGIALCEILKKDQNVAVIGCNLVDPARARLSKVTEEKNYVLGKNSRLQKKRESNGSRDCMTLMYVVIVLIGIIMGYLSKRTSPL